MNILLGIISILLFFISVVLIEKFFKKEGLFIWISLATVIANIIVCKTIKVLGITTSLGNIVFASNFLATDILSEKYGKKEAKNGVMMAFVFMILFVLITQLSLFYVPASEDVAHEAMKTLFSLNLRVSVASLLLFFISNNLDIFIFNKLAEKYPNKLWLRNNVATIIANCGENYFFVFLAFLGIYDMTTIISIATTQTIIEIIIALCDTPFLYLSKRIK